MELNSNSGGQLIGSILLDTSVKTVLAKYVSLSDLKVKLGDSEPYVNGRIGSWTSRA